MAPDVTARYQRASDLLEDVLAARSAPGPQGGPRRPTPPRSELTASGACTTGSAAREAPAPRFCWHCRKPLHARTDRCPFCGESQ